MIVFCSQDTRRSYAKVQNLLLKAANHVYYQKELQFVLSFYGSDFDSFKLSTQLEIFSQSFETAEEVPSLASFGIAHLLR